MPAKKKVEKKAVVKKVDSEKQLVVVKQQVTRATHAAAELKIKSQEDLQSASDLLGKIQAVANFVKKEKDGATRPSYTAYKEMMEWAKERFDPLLDDCSEAEKIVKSKAIEYRNKVNAEAEEKRLKLERDTAAALAKNPENEEKIMEKATTKMENLPVIGGKVEGDKGGGITFKKVKVVKVLKEQDVPREYLVLDMVKIKKDALAGVNIPGVVVVEEDQAVGAHNFG